MGCTNGTADIVTLKKNSYITEIKINEQNNMNIKINDNLNGNNELSVNSPSIKKKSIIQNNIKLEIKHKEQKIIDFDNNTKSVPVVNEIDSKNVEIENNTKEDSIINKNILENKATEIVDNINTVQNISNTEKQIITTNKIEENVKKTSKQKESKNEKKIQRNYEKIDIDKDELNKVFKDKIFQTIILLNYDQKKFPNHPRTLYFQSEFSELPPDLELIDESIGNYRYKYLTLKKKPKKKFLQRITIENKNFFLGIKTHKFCYTCIKKAFESNEFVILPNTNFNNLIWVDPNKDFNEYFKHLSKYQKYNHFPFSFETELKDNLYKHYTEMKTKFPDDYNYMFESYILPDQKDEFISTVLKGNTEYKLSADNMWILKPVGTFGGSGIKIMTDINDISGRVLASKYLALPYLINEKKFDLRLYALVTGYKPLRVYLYKDGIVRFASEKYNIDENNLGNLFIHLTNVCINCKYNNTGRTEKWRLKQFVGYLKKNKKIDFSPCFNKIKDIITKLFLSITDLAIDYLDKSNFNTNNLFEFFGFDVILDKDLNPYLLEINNNPMLSSFKNLDQEMKTCLISEIANIIGIVPYNKEYPDLNLDGMEPVYKNKVDEAVNECLCEFERPLGDWIRTFPLKDNIDYYKKFIEKPGDENLMLWDIIKNTK